MFMFCIRGFAPVLVSTVCGIRLCPISLLGTQKIQPSAAPTHHLTANIMPNAGTRTLKSIRR